MKSKLPFSHRWKPLGWILFILGSVTGILKTILEEKIPEIKTKVFAFASDEIFGKDVFFQWIEVDILITIAGCMIIIGGLIISFSREKTEDEFTNEMRLNSLLWAFAINYCLLLLAFIFIYNIAFLHVMSYGLFTTMLIFILRFHYIVMVNKRLINHEK